MTHLMRVWLTRTEPGATRQAATLAERGFDVLRAPVLGIEALPSAPPDGSFDVVVFVSEHAVSCAAANGWRGGPAIAIGEAAARALRSLGVEPAWPTQANAEGVVEAFAPMPPDRTLLVKGSGGTTTLQNWLRALDLEVLEWNVYRRVPLEPAISGEGIDAIVAASGDGLRVVEQLWFAQRGDARVPLLVPSERVARLARATGFEHVVVTAGAGAATVVEALQELADRSGDG
ncbi:MAG: uroporphyrinogen-III synthase [Gammaproteobacteria bacterium]|nr:uroporphyrinogen-III synthase [Gammaproteobacteria bacterium]